MEIIAITNWEKIVSPLYDVACFFSFEYADGARTIINIRGMSLFERAQYLNETGVTVLLCGAISCRAQAILNDKGIFVIAWLCGPVDEIIAAYKSNVSLLKSFALPGCEKAGICKRRRKKRKNAGFSF